MMYFTESGDAVEDPIKLNEESGAEYEMGPYEKKISLLLHHAYKRVCQESESKKSKWDEAIRRLERGDHYLLVMWGNRPGFHRVDFIGAAIGCLLLAFLYGVKWITRRFEPPNPRVLLGILAALIPFLVLCRRSLAKAADWIFDRHWFDCSVAERKKRTRTETVFYFRPRSFSNSDSERMGTPNSLALSYLEPGSAPTTT
jgi:hypothetical protein